MLDGYDWDSVPAAALTAEGMRKGAPFAGYDDFDACVAANGDKDDPDAYCATIMRNVEGKESVKTADKACPACHGAKWITTVGGNFPCTECGQTGKVPDDHKVQSAKQAAKPKGNRAPEEPTQQPMRPATQIRQSLSADQKRVRRQMTRKQAANTETCDHCGNPLSGSGAGRPGDGGDELICNRCEAPLDPALYPETYATRKQALYVQAAVPYEDRDPNEMTHSCAIGEHDDEDYPDTTCVCPCHDHWGVPEQYKEGWEDDQYHQPPFDRDTGPHPKYAKKESAMRTEATILREMATASLADQRVLAQELDDVRRARTASLRADREVDLADTIVRSHLTPVAVHTMHTAATDWVGEDEVHEDPSLAMKTEATLWFQRTSAEVRDDLEEFAIQAQGMATRLASRCGEQADAAFEAFIGHVDHLYRQAAKIAGDDASKTRTIDPDKNNGNAESGLPLEVDNDDTAFDDPGFLSDDDDTGVHPDMPGAKKGSRRTAELDPDDAGDYKVTDPATKSSCDDCGAPIERDPAGETNRTWHHDDGDSHDHEATPKTSAKTANEDNFGGKKAPPFGSKDGDDSDDSDANDYDSDPDDPHYGEGAKADRLSDKESAKTAAEEWKCEVCGKDAPVMVSSRDGGTRYFCYDHEDQAFAKKQSAKTAEQTPPEVDANTRLKDPETDPMLSEDWDHQSDDPETGTGAADVKDVPTPGGENGYPKPKTSMLDKAVAFRATVQANLER